MVCVLTRSYQMITAGFEPATVRLEGVCSIQLSYWTIICEFQQELIWLYVDSQNVLYVYFNQFNQLIRLLYHTLAQL